MAVDGNVLLDQLQILERRLSRMEDRDSIQRLQNMYGYYIDNRMWRALAALFADGRLEKPLAVNSAS